MAYLNRSDDYGLTRSRSSSTRASAPTPPAASPPAWSPAAWRSPLTSSTSTQGSSNTSKRAGRSGWRPSATPPTTSAAKHRLVHLDQLQARARAANRRLLDTERAGPGCVLASPAFARVAQPSTDGQARYPTGALRFGDPRVMALAGALCILLTSVVGFTHRSLRAQVTALLGQAYTASQMSSDLTRLGRKGLIRRLPRTNTYVLTSDGTRFALFSTKVHDRLLVPLLAANAPPASPQLRDALQVVDQSVCDYVRQACLKAA
jgi:hypothetical protein